MTELVTDEMVEAAARATSMAVHGVPDEYSDYTRDRVRIALEAAAPLIAGRALKRAADDWQTGEWANVPRKADRVADRLGAAQHVSDWLRAEAGRTERSGR